MKVLLINSPIYNKKVADKEDYLPPFGQGYIATSLKNQNIDTQIIDAVYNNYTVNELLQIIEIEKPDAVGINIFSINYDLVKELIEKCQTNTTFIVGGKSTKFLYKDIINFNTKNQINIIIGEGEYIIPDIVKHQVIESPVISKENKNVYQVNNNSLYFPSDLSRLQLDRSLFDGRQITNVYGEIEEAIVTSRECLYNCAFCGGARSLNKDVEVRIRSKEDITKELEYIKQTSPDTQSIRILDDLFLKNANSIKTAIEIFEKFNFHWRAMCHINSLKNADDLLEKLYSSGCRELEIGIESGSERIRNYIHKIGSIEEIKIGIKKLLEAGINVKGYFMYGLPTETYEECMQTFELATTLSEISKYTKGKFRTSAFQFRPYHGTELYNRLNKKIEYRHNDDLNTLEGRKQFNFTAGNFSNCPDEIINELIIKTNQIGEEYQYEGNQKVSAL